MKKKLNNILQELYKTNWNITYTDTLSNGLNIDKTDLDKILRTKSINNWYLIWRDDCSSWYLRVELTDLWNKYVEDLNKSRIEKIILHINNLSWFYTVIIAWLALVISILSLIISISN